MCARECLATGQNTDSSAICATDARLCLVCDTQVPFACFDGRMRGLQGLRRRLRGFKSASVRFDIFHPPKTAYPSKCWTLARNLQVEGVSVGLWRPTSPISQKYGDVSWYVCKHEHNCWIDGRRVAGLSRREDGGGGGGGGGGVNLNPLPATSKLRSVVSSKPFYSNPCTPAPTQSLHSAHFRTPAVLIVSGEAWNLRGTQ
ncbi:hypothetical protein BV25DRAFT_763495 [Artomyces pyxidatus]|uniref:Uncharacterized protein n=1 Tax=Artomyces pyxidatus TaxID=48021 RepID=A0ACB8SYF5_9AGAM|nr:hypothetical protein BV25DRAFT_763495 [Artomyces pyxidatus]